MLLCSLAAGCVLEQSPLGAADAAVTDAGGLDGAATEDAGGGGIDGGTRDGGSRDAAARDGGRGDAGRVDAGLDCPGERRVWHLTFDEDPTGVDHDGDGTDDWTVRGGGAFPTGDLSGGVWHASPGPVLDSRPLHDFTGRTTVDVRMRATSSGSLGAVFWLNLDYAGTRFAAVFVSVTTDGASQRVELNGKPNAGTHDVLATLEGLGTGFLRVRLDFDPASDEVSFEVNGAELGTFAYPTFGPVNDDRFATLMAWSAAAEFDLLHIETCDP